MLKHTTKLASAQEAERHSTQLADACYQFLRPLLCELHTYLDRRLVLNFLGLVVALLRWRHRQSGLLLSELGGYLLSPAQAPAGTKRLSRLLHSPRWQSHTLLQFLWHHADQRVHALGVAGDTPLVVWDESVLEKPESLHLAGLCPVRSTKAARLQRIKPGYFHPPSGRPICVPGWHWLAMLVLGSQGPVTLATMRPWSTRGDQAQRRRQVEYALLTEVWQRWGARVVHLWDRGFAGHPWIRVALIYRLRFILRWPKRQTLRDGQGQVKPAWKITRGKRSWGHRLVWDARRRCWRRVGIYATPVYEVTTDHRLWLVVARRGQGQSPWYLLTTEAIESLEQAWQVVRAYARRWQIEMMIRFDKSELAFESVRLRQTEAQHKLWGIASLAYAFLLSLLTPAWKDVVTALLTTWCHRTGQWSRATSAPLYRLRAALAHLWLTHPPPVLTRLNSG